MKYLLDTNIFNRIKDQRLHISDLALSNKSVFLVTNVQRCEIEATTNQKRRKELLEVFEKIQLKNVPIESFALDIPGAGLDESKLNHDPRVYELKNDLDAENNGKSNNWQDVLIAEVALLNGYCLVTTDKNLADVSKKQGILVIHITS